MLCTKRIGLGAGGDNLEFWRESCGLRCIISSPFSLKISPCRVSSH
jgi:hypothetical protein